MRKAAFLLCAALLFHPLASLAQAVTVTSGKHKGFTRLALDFGRDVDWQLGRVDGGYALRVTGPTADYDLSTVFDAIGRDRISDLRIDKTTGDLELVIGCACYAMPFSFRPSIVVIDVKEGKPPARSAFEGPLPKADDSVAESPTALPDPGDGQPAYDWIEARTGSDPAPPLAPAPQGTVPVSATVSAPVSAPQDLELLRKALVEELSRGAAAGLVDLTLPRNPTGQDLPGHPSAEIALGDVKGQETHLGEKPDTSLTATGDACIGDAELDVFSWALSKESVVRQMSQLTSGVVGEFDKPDRTALSRAVKFELYLGFGAEARALMQAFPGAAQDEQTWASIASILDDSPEHLGTFRTQAACDTAAALWAILSIDDLSREIGVNSKAAVRAFSALPAHLRLLLGPRLADKFLSIHEEEAASTVRDAVARLPGSPPSEVTLLQARLDAAAGDLPAAATRLEPLAKEVGPNSAEALAELVLARAGEMKPVEIRDVDALAALVQERRATPDAARFERALTLGLAASGQFDAAFARLPEQDELRDQVWSLLSVLGTDADLLSQAILPADQLVKTTLAAPRIAERLLELGFVDQAARWRDLSPDRDPRLDARIAIARKDGSTALKAIAGIDEPEALRLKAQSLDLSGNFRAAADLYRALGAEADYWSSEGRARDWPVLAQAAPDPWQPAARVLVGDPAGEPAGSPALNSAQTQPGPLARARAIVQSSEDTRRALAALLSGVPVPSMP